MSAEQVGPRAPEEAAPPSSEETAPPSEDIAPPDLQDEAPPPLKEKSPPPPGEAAFAEDAAHPFQEGPSPSASDYLNLIPSEEKIILPDDDEPDPHRVRPRPAPRLVQSVLSEMLSQSSRRSSKFRRSMSGIPNLQETLKEKQVLLIIRFFICVSLMQMKYIGGFSS